MLELIYLDGILTKDSINYMIVSLEMTSDINVFVGLENDIYNNIIVLVANETTINDVLQTSAQMIYDTLTSNV